MSLRGNLDPDTAWEIMSLLNAINRRGTTVVVATHAKDIVDKMQKRVIAIDKGSIYADNESSGYVDEHKDGVVENPNDYSHLSRHNFPWSKRKAGA